MNRSALTAVVVLLGGAAFSLLAWTVPGFDVAYGSEGMHIALEAISASVALLVGALAWSNFVRTRRVADLLVAAAFGFVVVVQQLFLLALPTLLNAEVPRPFSEWSATTLTVLASLLLAASAFAPSRTTGLRATIAASSALVAIVTGAVLTFLLLEARLPLVVDPALSPVNPRARPFTAAPAVVAAEVGAFVLLVTATARLSTRREPQLLLRGWLAPALALAAVSHANEALFSSAYSYWIYSGDILGLAACVVLAWGIVAEVRFAARRAIDVAMIEERRRVARDLHDGLAQELAFVAAELSDMPTGLHPSLPWIRSAVERALFESRSAIAALTLPVDLPLASAVAAEAGEISARDGVSLRLDLDESLEVDGPVREAILRVVREAVTNAVRHGRASVVRVSLRHEPAAGARLTIIDDGVGLDGDADGRGFGLISMRERVVAADGSIVLASPPSGGTAVEVWWPPQTAARRNRSSVS